LFEKHRAKKARQEYEAALAAWQSDHQELAGLIALARGTAAIPSSLLVLERGETVVGTVSGTGLIEIRRSGGHYQGGSTGLSIPVGKVGGRSVRYRVGATRGHYVQGAPHAESVDHGTMSITSQRLVFTGNAKSIECLYAKLVSVQRAPGELHVAVSNRQKPTVLHYGSSLDDWVAIRVELALALFHGEADGLARQLENELASLDAGRPQPPAGG
jgi:hypothetical protein